MTEQDDAGRKLRVRLGLPADDEDLTFVGKLVVYPLVAIVMMVWLSTSMLLTGFAVQHLWLWFVVPLGAPAISLWHAAGIDLLVTLIAYPGYLGKQLKGTCYLKRVLLLTFVRPAGALGFGWVAQFMMGVW